MATDTERLLFLLEANTKSFENALARADRTASRRMAAMEKRAVLMEQRLTASMRNAARDGGAALTQLISATAVTAVAVGTKNLADAYTNLSNQMRLYADSQAEANENTQFAIDTAAEARVPIRELAGVYAAVARASVDLGISQNQQRLVIEATAKATAMATTSTNAMQGALMQFAQAMGSGMVQAQEFNSIMDGTPALAQALAWGIDEAGGSVSRLRTLVRDGKISSQQFAQALIEVIPRIREGFKLITPTIDQSFSVLQTRLIEFIGGADDAVDATENISKAIDFVANNLELFADATRVFIGEMIKIGGVVVPVAALGSALVALNNVFVALRAAAVAGAAATATVGTAGALSAPAMGLLAAATTRVTGALAALRVAAAAFIASPLAWALTAVGFAAGFAAVETMRKVEASQLAAEQAAKEKQEQDELLASIDALTLAEGEERKAKIETIRASIAKQQQTAAELRQQQELKGAILETARAEVAAARARLDAQLSLRETGNFGQRIDAGLGGVPIAQDNLRAAAAIAAEAEAANTAADNAARRAEEFAASAQRRLDEALNPRPLRSPGGGRDSGSRGPTEASLRAARNREEAAARRAERDRIQAARERQDAETQRLENELEIAQANREQTDALEDQITVRRMAAAMDQNGLITAANRAAAEAHVNTLRRITNEQRQEELHAIARQDQIEQAMLERNWQRVRELEKEEEILSRRNQYLALGLSAIDANTRATAEATASQERRARAAEQELALEEEQARIAMLRAQGKNEEAEAAELLLEHAELMARYDAAGVANAKDRVDALQRLLADTRAIARVEGERNRQAERQVELLRMQGLERQAEAMARENERRRRTRELADNRGMSNEEAGAVVASEMDEEAKARVRGQVRDVVREGWLEALKEGSIENTLNSLFDRVMDNLAETLTDIVMDALTNLRKSQTGAPSGGGLSALLAEGLKWLPTLFGKPAGMRDSGGSTAAGKSYIVGENGPEIWSSSHAGRVTGRAQTKKLLGGGGPSTLTINVNAEGAVLAETLRRDQMAAVALAIRGSRQYGADQDYMSKRYRRT